MKPLTPVALDVLLDKINHLYRTMRQGDGTVSSLELDLLRAYTREWYDGLLNWQAQSAGSTASGSAADRNSLVSGEGPQSTPRPYPAPQPTPVPGPLPGGMPGSGIGQSEQMERPAAESDADQAAAAAPVPRQPAPPASEAAASAAPVSSQPARPAVPPAPAPNPPSPPAASAPTSPSAPVTRPQVLGSGPSNPQPEEVPALNDRFSTPEKVLGEVLVGRPAEDLRRLIDVNERFLFTRELFDGNSDQYGQAIRALNEQPTLPEALRFFDGELLPRHQWDPESKVVRHLRDILEQRYRP